MKAPSVFQLKRLMELVNYVIFPDYSDVPAWTNGTEAIRAILAEQLATVTSVEQSEQVANGFVATLPEISRLLHTDADAVMHNDPAVDSMQEVILCYPVVKVMIHHRTAHWLHRQEGRQGRGCAGGHFLRRRFHSRSTIGTTRRKCRQTHRGTAARHRRTLFIHHPI